MYNFNFHSPSSLDEAINIYNNSDDPKFLAGGMTLLASMKQRLIAPSDLIDIRNIKNLSEVIIDGESIKIGALYSHHSLSINEDINSKIKNLAKLANGIGDPAVRKMGTIGGSIANSDPAADWPAAILALNSNINTNIRSIKNIDFFTGMFETLLADDEIITSIDIKIPDLFDYKKFPNPASRYAIVGVAIAKYNNDVTVSVSGASHTPFIAKGLSEFLSENFSSDIPKNTVSKDDLNEDIHASAEYRANLIDVLTQQILKNN